MDIVTSIEIERKRAKVTINETEVIYFTPRLVRERGLMEGDELDISELREWLLLRQYPYALDQAVRALAARPCSRGEIEKKLRDKRMMDETIEMVITKLNKEKLLNDADFAVGWAQARTHRQLGKQRIKQELRQKGVEASVIDSAFEELDEEETDKAISTLARKLIKRYQNEEPKKAMEKAVNAMLRRGFGYQEAVRALEKAINDELDEEEDE